MIDCIIHEFINLYFLLNICRIYPQKSENSEKSKSQFPRMQCEVFSFCLIYTDDIFAQSITTTGLQSRLSLLLHRPLQQPDMGHHLQQLLRPEQREHAGRARRDRQRGIPLRQQHAHQQRVHRHEPGQPWDPQGGHPVCSGPHRQRQDRHVREVRTRDNGEFFSPCFHKEENRCGGVRLTRLSDFTKVARTNRLVCKFD